MRFIACFLTTALFACSPVNKDLAELSPSGQSKIIVLKVTSTIDKPQGSQDLRSALEQSKRLLANKQAVNIELAAGTYSLEQSIILDASYSGSPDYPFVIKAAPNAQVTISGGKTLKLDWQPYSDGIYQADLGLENSAFDQLFIDGELQHRARYPNYDPNVAIYNSYAADAISPERIKSWRDPVGAYVHALHEGRWGGMHYQITGVNPDYSLELNGGFQNNRQSPLHQKYRYVENVFSELDAPNEWFYDGKQAKLYFYPPVDMDLQSVKVNVSGLNNLVEIRGDKALPVKHIVIKNIEFKHTNKTFMLTSEPLLRSDWAIYRGGAVLLEHSENVKILDSRFVDLGGNAVFVSNYNRKTEISGNEIHDIGASAISFVGNPDAVRSPSFEYNEFVSLDEMDFTPGPKTPNYPSDSLVSNNLIYDIGLVEKQVAGVQLSMAMNITVSHNSIYRVPRAGINVSEGTWGGHVVEFNDVFDTVLETGDHGAFNSWGRDRFWHPERAQMDRIAKLHPGMWQLDAQLPIIIRNNRFQCDHGWDIDLDDGSSNYQIYNNVALNGGIKLREGFARTVENNIIINNSFHPHVWFENSEDVFRQNLVMSSHKPILNEHWGREIDYNIFTTPGALEKAQSLGLDQHSIFIQPAFVDAQNGDYRLSEESALPERFVNFPMDQFGVASEHLKLKAEQPVFPQLYLAANNESDGQQIVLMGATFKTLTTVGEQSALGAPEVAGAMVIEVAPNSKAKQQGLMGKDLILEVLDTQFGGSDKINNINDLLTSYQSRKWRGVFEVQVLRNQQRINLQINLVD
jgi:hypothetical protein